MNFRVLSSLLGQIFYSIYITIVTVLRYVVKFFQGKSAVWVPYPETGYTKGKKLGEKDGKIEVERLVDGKVKAYKKEQVEPQNPPKYELLEGECEPIAILFKISR